MRPLRSLKNNGWFILIYLIYVVSSVFIAKNSFFKEKIIRSDGLGYYLYLPALFIYQDPEYAFFDSTFVDGPLHHPGEIDRIVLITPDGNRINKYPPGVALTSSPFFAIAHAYGLMIDQAKGYENHYQWAWQIASMFHVGLGLFFLFAIGRLAKTRVWPQLFVVVGILFGTNLFHFATFDAGFSHAFTFAWVAGACYFILKGSRWFPAAAICMGMIILNRPFNVVILPMILLATIPVNQWISVAKNNTRQISISALMLILAIGIYVLSIYWQTGKPFTYSYVDEVFHFDDPHFVEFLFGFRAGAFLFSPLYLVLIIISGYLLFRNKSWINATLLILGFLAIAWVLSCWHWWTFGCTLGNRPLVDILAIFGVAILTNLGQPRLKWFINVLLALILLFSVFYNQIIHYQYRVQILNWCNTLTQQEFFDIFLKTDKDYTYYTAQDRRFPDAFNEKTEAVFAGNKDSIYVDQTTDEITLLTIDSLNLQNGRINRLLFTFNGKFDQTRADSKVIVFMSKHNGEYHDFQQEFVKKDLKAANRWTQFKLEFELTPSDDPLIVYFKLRDNQESQLHIRDIRCEWISYQE